jgi:hypothetical protein
MYEAYSVINDSSDNIFLGETFGNKSTVFNQFTSFDHDSILLKEAINYASFRLLKHRFSSGPNARTINQYLDSVFLANGGDELYKSVNYSTGKGYALGNYIAQEIIAFGQNDGANEQDDYANLFYSPKNPPIAPEISGNNGITDPNRWQQIELDVQIDQSGNQIPGNTQPFLGAEWGNVIPFALKDSDKTTRTRDGQTYTLYNDLGPPPYIDSADTESSDLYKWAFSLVSIWSSYLSSGDTTTWDISPGSIGNIQSLPNSYQDFQNFYTRNADSAQGFGHDLNPNTGLPYAPQRVKRGDYTRSIAEYWADGPDSETPPGHWFTILNHVGDNPLAHHNFRNKLDIQNKLRWEIYSYLIMGASMHDVAISSWAMKGYYDYIRPISALRYMGDQGQSSDSTLPNYSKNGIPLIAGLIEQVGPADYYAVINKDNLNKIKVYTWKGPDFISKPNTDTAGVGWIMLKDWWPYQRPSFVTPPFSGFISGHSTFSSAAAEVMEAVTGDPFFPGGLGEWDIKKNEFLVFEEGPSESFKLQWATYKDAAAQSGISRIFGGIHPPFDDIPGRKLGVTLGQNTINKAELYIMPDRDNDGFSIFEDKDDTDNNVYPNAPEICDGKDNDGNGLIDENLPRYVFFLDNDKDGFGDPNIIWNSCLDTLPINYCRNDLDCDDSDSLSNPLGIEILDNGKDENCDGTIDKHSLTLGPNPVNSDLTISYLASQSYKIHLYNSQGQLVYKGNAVQNETEHIISFRGLRDGIFLLHILDQNKNTIHFSKIAHIWE